jgi:hypothetical protein
VTTDTFAFGTPVNLDNHDGTTLYVLGDHWTASADGSFTGVEWYVPATLSGDNHYILAYQDGDGDSPRKTKAISPVAGGGLQRFLFTTPLAITSGTGYFACVLTNHYVFTNGYTFPHTDGRLTTDGFSIVPTGPDNAKIPNTPSALNFHISPVVDFATETHSVSVAVSLGLAVADTAHKAGQVRAAATLTLGGSTADTAHRTSSVEAALGLAVDVHNRNPATAAGGSGGWYGLLGILQENRAEREYWRNQRPIACPNDGEPLLTGPHGELYCPFDGWRYDG